LYIGGVRERVRLAFIIKGVCPACGQTPLFHHFIIMQNICTNCKTDFASKDVGDGAVFIAILSVSIIITILSVLVELSYQPSFWIHTALWLPLTILFSLIALRVGRAFTLSLILSQESSK
jgi:uncharacterized protein (DUF983 family)